MRLFKKTILLVIVFTMFLGNNSVVKAFPTPVFDSLTPKLQEFMRIHAQERMRIFPQYHPANETLEDLAEQHLCNYHVYFDGNLYRGHGGPMKLTNEDIESLYNLPYVKQLDLKRFDLKDVDITKFLNINKNKTMQFLDLKDCFFSLTDNEIRSTINDKGYKVEEGSDYWILWPGVDIYDIIDDGRLKNCH